MPITRIKIIGGLFGAFATIGVACFGWVNSAASIMSVNSARLDRMELHIEKITDQYQRYDDKLSALVHKQDVRISLLESIVRQQLSSKEKNHGN